MFIKVGDREYPFHRIRIELIETGIQELFRLFDKKTIRELLQHRRYEHLKEKVIKEYTELLDVPAGIAIYQMKKIMTSFTKNF